MNAYLLVFLRIVHVFAGTLWIGAAVVYLFFIKPSVKAIGPAGPQFMQSLAERRKYPLYMVTASLLTVAAGVVLYLHDSAGLNLAWITTGTGLGFTLGAGAALVAFLVGNFGIGPASAQMGALGQKIAQSGGKPDSAQLRRLQALERKLSTAETVDMVMLAVSLVAMATARYWGF